MKTFLAFTTGLLGGFIITCGIWADMEEKEKLKEELESLKANDEKSDE